MRATQVPRSSAPSATNSTLSLSKRTTFPELAAPLVSPSPRQ